MTSASKESVKQNTTVNKCLLFFVFQLFTGNIVDSNTPVIQLFPKSINATNVKIEPTKWFNQHINWSPCLRFELLGHRLN